MYWYRDRWRESPEARCFLDIELGFQRKPTRRVDSAISLGSSEACGFCTTLKLDLDPHEFIILTLDFEDVSCVKSLDYRTFSHWDAMEGLLLDLEKEGITVGELWDQTEKMRICCSD
jgi:hypothetical protein